MLICKCSCHLKGIMHFLENCNCCNHPYDRYLNQDGTIDKEDLD